MPSKAERAHIAQERYQLCEKAIVDCVAIIEATAEKYGPRFKPNGAHEAIMHEIGIRIARRGRKPKAKAVES